MATSVAMSERMKSCRDCRQLFPIAMARCPHCARPGLFPNVELAELDEERDAHRASVFEESSVLFMQRHRVQLTEAHELPAGYRAPWSERAKLCVAKLAGKVDAGTTEDAFPEVLLRQGKTPEDDEFVEVHVGGPMTVRTLERVILHKRMLRRVEGKTLREKLESFGVEVERRTWTP